MEEENSNNFSIQFDELQTVKILCNVIYVQKRKLLFFGQPKVLSSVYVTLLMDTSVWLSHTSMTHLGISLVDVVVLGAVTFGGGGGLFEGRGLLKLCCHG